MDSDQPTDCVEHEWATVDMTLARDGTYVERRCARCDAVTMVGPRELGGWV